MNSLHTIGPNFAQAHQNDNFLTTASPMSTNLKLAFCILTLALLSACASQPIELNQALSQTPGKIPEMCAAENGAPFSYRKKIAILTTDVRDPQPDLPGLGGAWTDALQRRLSDSQRFLINDASQHHLYSGEQQREWIIALAQQLDVQFIIAVRFHNLHLNRSQLGSGNYTIPLPGAERQIDAELLIFDGYYGSQLKQFSHNVHVSGSNKELVNPAHQPILRGHFMTTTLGQAMSTVLDAQVNDTLAALACLPLMERALKVAGQKIHIRSRAASLIRPGDALQLFYKHGVTETHLGTVKISRIFPESAVGIYQGQERLPQFAQGLRLRAW